MKFEPVEENTCPLAWAYKGTKARSPKVIKRLLQNNRSLVNYTLGNLNVTSTGSISEGALNSMDAGAFFRPWSRGGTCPSYAMM